MVATYLQELSPPAILQTKLQCTETSAVTVGLLPPEMLNSSCPAPKDGELATALTYTDK